jgi:3-hydroxyacyl-[acyl-carrier-protein] dehydratase
MKVIKNYVIDPQQPLLRGHFPGRPILPGVMLLGFVKDAFGQALYRRCRIKSIIRHKFVKPVLPGYSIRVECDVAHTELAEIEAADACPVNCRIFDQDENLVAAGSYQIEFLPS